MVLKSENPMTNKADKVHKFCEFLREEGYFPKLDDDGDITFKVAGHIYLVSLDDDEQYLRIVFPNFWEVDSQDERQIVEKVALEVTAQVKAAKVFITKNDKVSAAIEMFSSSLENSKIVFERCLAALNAAVGLFLLTMLKEKVKLELELE